LQNLNNFFLDNIGILVAVALFFIIGVAFYVVLKCKNNEIKELVLQQQGELTGRLAALGEITSHEQNRLFAAINEQKLAMLKIVDDKLLAVTKSVDEGLKQNTAKTDQTLVELKERLVKIDTAQQKISSLSEQVVSLQEVLSNKQARGAFGEIQLNDLVTSILPPNSYSFQTLLSNGKKADCLLKLPNPPGIIAIDAKFPLESYHALRNSKTDRDRLEANRFFKSSVLKHIKDIAEKYIISGETAESALMFLPSEAIYAELHANFVDVVEMSYKSKVWIVSPTTLMATLNTIRAILKDAHMREQAGVIQKEVGMLIDDICRLNERVENLGRHFKLASEDIESIKTSSNKINRRIEKIESIEVKETNNKSIMYMTVNE